MKNNTAIRKDEEGTIYEKKTKCFPIARFKPGLVMFCILSRSRENTTNTKFQTNKSEIHTTALGHLN